MSDTLEMKMRLNLSLTLNHCPFEIYGVETRQFLRKRSGESMRHVVMKWLSYILFYHDDLQIEASASQHFKPDLVRFGEDGRVPVQWIDCGQTALQKLDKISQKNRETMIDIVKATPQELEAYKLQANTRLKAPERVRYWSFEDGLVQRLGSLLHGRHDVIATVSKGFEYVYLVIDGQKELRARVVWLNQAVSPVKERVSLNDKARS